MKAALCPLLLALAGCTVFSPPNVKDQIDMVRKAGGSGCVLIRGNSRPYADVSMVAVSTLGKDSNYLDCVEKLKDQMH